MIEGKNTREVWDYRLSTASIYIDRRGGTWVCVIVSKSNPDYVEGAEPTEPLETYDTGIEAVEDDEYDTAKVAACYEWFKSVRDKYSHPNIEQLKPMAAKANKLMAEYAEITQGMDRIQAITCKEAILKLEEMNEFKCKEEGE